MNFEYNEKVFHEKLEKETQDLIDSLGLNVVGNKNTQCDLSKKIRSYERDALRCKKGENVILYGVPGSGKSYKIKMEYCKDPHYMERIVFHPDYTYSDFIG